MKNIILFLASLLFFSNFATGQIKPNFRKDSTDNCDGPFLIKIGNENENEMPISFISSGTGKFYSGGRKDNVAFLFAFNDKGELQSQKTFNLTSGDDFIDDIFQDSEGNLLLLSRNQSNAATDNFIIKYNPENEEIIWIKEFPIPAYTRLESIIELNSIGAYQIAGLIETGSGHADAFLMQIEKETGNLIWQKGYNVSAFELFNDILVIDDALYACGTERANGGINKIRTSVTKLDFSGNVIWNRIYLNAPSETGRTYGTGIIEGDDGSITFLSRGSTSTSESSQSDFQLLNIDTTGLINWARNYHILGGTYTQGRQIIKIQGGYIIHGRYKSGSDWDFFFARTDNYGNLIWSNSISTDYDDQSLNFGIYNDFIYFFARTNKYDTFGNYDGLFGKMTLDGEISVNNCELVNDLEITITDISDTYNGELPLPFSVKNNPLNNFVTTLGEVFVSTSEIPGCGCLPDTCKLDLGTDIFSCWGEPVMLDAGEGLLSYLWSDGSMEQTLTTTIAGTYTVTVTTGCGTTLSDTIIINSTPPVDLGADTISIIQGDTVFFSIPGYDSYQWSPWSFLNCYDCSDPYCLPDSSISVTIAVIDNAGCHSLDTVFIQVEPNTINEATKYNNNISISPNPTKNYFEIRTKLRIINRILVFDNMGRIVSNSAFTEKIFVGNIPKGIYYIQFRDKNNKTIAIKKLVIIE